MNIHPIRNDSDHEAALREIEHLWGSVEGTADGDRLDVLAVLVEDYESRRWAIAEADPIEVIQYAISEMGRSQAELAEILGSAPRASEILRKKRALTTEMVHKISKAWHLPASLLVAPYDLDVVRERMRA